VGLDLVVEGCAKPGHESEWRRILERSLSGEEVSEADAARFQEISTPGYQRIGAPQVGFDDRADEWILKARKVTAPEDVIATLKGFHGYYVLRLVTCDGVPKYSNGSLYDGIDETSFRGAFLTDCQDVLGKHLLDEAWGDKSPEEAVAYGRALLARADAAEAAGLAPMPVLGPAETTEPVAMAEQLDIVRAAGRWFVFWGERGHPIRAWF
jgi:hypothetical protein